MSEYVSTLKAFDVIKAIELAGELQASMKATQDDADSNISSLSGKLGKVQKAERQFTTQPPKQLHELNMYI
jgi:hypothetical protein